MEKTELKPGTEAVARKREACYPRRHGKRGKSVCQVRQEVTQWVWVRHLQGDFESQTMGYNYNF